MVERLLSKYSSVIFFDTETDGLPEQGYDRIISLSAVKMEKSGGRVVFSHFNRYISLNTISPLSAKITELTGITQELLNEQGRPEKEVCPAFCAFIDGENVLIVAHNASFDLRFLSKMLSRQNMDPRNYLAKFDFLDTQSVYMDRAAKPHKLSSAIEHYGLQEKAKNNHHSMEDSRALVFLLDAMMREKLDISKYINLFAVSAKNPGYRNPKITYVRSTGLYGSAGKRLYELTAEKEARQFDLSYYGGDNEAPYAKNAYITLVNGTIFCLLDGFRNQKNLKQKPAQLRFQKYGCTDGKDRWLYIMPDTDGALQKLCAFWEKNWIQCYIRKEEQVPYIHGFQNFTMRQASGNTPYAS